MKKVIINENQIGFLFKNGKYVKTVGAGKYLLAFGKEIEVIDCDKSILSTKASLETLLSDNNFKNLVSTVEVNDDEIAVHFINGRFSNVIVKQGKFAYYKGQDTYTFQIINTSNPEIPEDLPRYILGKIPNGIITKFVVLEYQKGCLKIDNNVVKILEPGVYYFWNTKDVYVYTIDTRLTKLDIVGQEIMTKDKVNLRINFVCNYRVTDVCKALTEIDDYVEQMHVLAQLAMRDYVGRYTLDEILEKKDEMSEYILDKMKSREADLFVNIKDAGIKDIILPGNIREIMNTVLIAEKKAQANVITRREEVASTRSLLNTAKLMEENQTLYKLKELEYAERIFENVGNITLNGNGDMLNQLLNMVGGKGNKNVKDKGD